MLPCSRLSAPWYTLLSSSSLWTRANNHALTRKHSSLARQTGLVMPAYHGLACRAAAPDCSASAVWKATVVFPATYRENLRGDKNGSAYSMHPGRRPGKQPHLLRFLARNPVSHHKPMPRRNPSSNACSRYTFQRALPSLLGMLPSLLQGLACPSAGKPPQGFFEMRARRRQRVAHDNRKGIYADTRASVSGGGRRATSEERRTRSDERRTCRAGVPLPP